MRALDKQAVVAGSEVEHDRFELGVIDSLHKAEPGDTARCKHARNRRTAARIYGNLVATAAVVIAANVHLGRESDHGAVARQQGVGDAANEQRVAVGSEEDVECLGGAVVQLAARTKEAVRSGISESRQGG